MKISLNPHINFANQEETVESYTERLVRWYNCQSNECEYEKTLSIKEFVVDDVTRKFLYCEKRNAVSNKGYEITNASADDILTLAIKLTSLYEIYETNDNQGRLFDVEIL